jgi:hypothetical protein
MSELTGVPATVFIRAAVIRHLAWIHAQEFPGINSPWDDEAGVEPRVQRRVVEGLGDSTAAVNVLNRPTLDSGGVVPVPRAAECDAGGAAW